MAFKPETRLRRQQEKVSCESRRAKLEAEIITARLQRREQEKKAAAEEAAREKTKKAGPESC